MCSSPDAGKHADKTKQNKKKTIENDISCTTDTDWERFKSISVRKTNEITTNRKDL